MPEQTSDVLTVEVGTQDDPFLPEGWELVEQDSGANEANLSGPVFLEIVRLLGRDENHVGGEEMLRRAKKLGRRAGLRCAKALKRQQHLIPAKLRYKTLVFADTVARDHDGNRFVPCLCWDGDQWCRVWRWLARDLGSRSRVVRLGK